jgi:hypothetical protein
MGEVHTFPEIWVTGKLRPLTGAGVLPICDATRTRVTRESGHAPRYNNPKWSGYFACSELTSTSNAGNSRKFLIQGSFRK